MFNISFLCGDFNEENQGRTTGAHFNSKNLNASDLSNFDIDSGIKTFILQILTQIPYFNKNFNVSKILNA